MANILAVTPTTRVSEVNAMSGTGRRSKRDSPKWGSSNLAGQSFLRSGIYAWENQGKTSYQTQNFKHLVARNLLVSILVSSLKDWRQIPLFDKWIGHKRKLLQINMAVSVLVPRSKVTGKWGTPRHLASFSSTNSIANFTAYWCTVWTILVTFVTTDYATDLPGHFPKSPPPPCTLRFVNHTPRDQE